MARKLYTFDEHLKASLRNPAFRKAWKESELEFQISRAIIENRLAKKMSQKELAKRVKTTQAVISRIEGMNSNPTVGLLSRIARALGQEMKVQFQSIF